MPSDGIRALLIAESPPAQDDDVPSFFYYDEDDLRKIDGPLFREAMAGLYPEKWKGLEWLGESVGKNKRTMLTQFSSDGLYMIDATDVPMQHWGKTEKKRWLRKVKESCSLVASLTSLATRGYLSSNTRIYITSCLVYDELFEHLLDTTISLNREELRLNTILSRRRTPLPFNSNDNAERFRTFIRYLKKEYCQKGD